MTSRKAIQWAVICVACLIALFLVVGGVNHALGFVPFTDQWRAKRNAVKVESLEGEVDTLQREATGNAEIGQAVETYHTREIVVRDATADAIAKDRSAPDATEPLTPERANRLRAADRVLCDHSGLCAAPADDAGGGPEAVSGGDTPD